MSAALNGIVVILYLLFKGSAQSACPAPGLRPRLHVFPTARIRPGGTLTAHCSIATSGKKVGHEPQITWSIYKKEWGYLQYTLVPPQDRKIKLNRNITIKGCGPGTLSTLKLSVSERLHRATLACFAHDTTQRPQRCVHTDTNCVQSQPIKVRMKTMLERCGVQVGVYGVLVASWAMLLAPLMALMLWHGTRSMVATEEALLEDDDLVFEV